MPKLLKTALCGLLVFLSSACDGKASKSVLWPQEVLNVSTASNNASSIRFITPIGSLDEPNDCGNIHLLEHLLGRQVQFALKESKLTSGFQVTGFTGPDRMIISIDLRGELAELEIALEALSKEIREFDPSKKIIDQEIKLVNFEKKVKKPSLSSIEATLQSVSSQQRARIMGICPDILVEKYKNELPANYSKILEHSRIVIVTSLPKSKINHLINPTRNSHHNSGNAPRNRLDFDPNLNLVRYKSNSEISLFVQTVQKEQSFDDLAVSVGFWFFVVDSLRNQGSSNVRYPRFSPLGSLGYQVDFTTGNFKLDRTAIRSLAQQFSDHANYANSIQSINRAVALICKTRIQEDDGVAAISNGLAMSPWTTLSQNDSRCRKELKKNQVFEIDEHVKIDISNINFLKNVQPFKILPRSDLPEEKRISICAPSIDRTRKAFHILEMETLLSIIKNKLRYQDGLILNIKRSRTTQDEINTHCISFIVVAPEQSLLAIRSALHEARLDENIDSELQRSFAKSCLLSSLSSSESPIKYEVDKICEKPPSSLLKNNVRKYLEGVSFNNFEKTHNGSMPQL